MTVLPLQVAYHQLGIGDPKCTFGISWEPNRSPFQPQTPLITAMDPTTCAKLCPGGHSGKAAPCFYYQVRECFDGATCRAAVCVAYVHTHNAPLTTYVSGARRGPWTCNFTKSGPLPCFLKTSCRFNLETFSPALHPS
jgi:hypothetical protein